MNNYQTFDEQTQRFSYKCCSSSKISISNHCVISRYDLNQTDENWMKMLDYCENVAVKYRENTTQVYDKRSSLVLCFPNQGVLALTLPFH